MPSAAKQLLRRLYWSVMRTVPPRRRREFLYLRWHRRPLSLEQPRRFSEKVNWRILNDRDAELRWTCDKLQMKERATELAPQVRVPRTFWHGVDLRELADVDLPDRWVLKPNHRSGLIHFGTGRPDVVSLASTTHGWLEEYHRRHLAEWAYGEATRELLVEEFISNDDRSPSDYKFFVFHGEPMYVQVDTDRFTGHQRRIYSTTTWSALPVANFYTYGPETGAPPQLADMRAIAARIGSPFDFMRVDLYAVGQEVYFGETTPYPGSGLEPYNPDSFDFELGEHWKRSDGFSKAN